MKSSTGAHYIALDHVRALAALLVITWHFIHSGYGFPVAFNYVPLVPFFALLDEGHTGVALFMTLSGYLFAKLLDGKDIIYSAFFLNRALRLLPLLLAVIILVGIQDHLHGGNLFSYIILILRGALLPVLPNGGWSITVEFHFYLVLPLLLWLFRRSTLFPIVILIAAIALRSAIYLEKGEVQSLAYWTIIGRIDQFTLGMLIFQLRGYFRGKHLIAIGTLGAFALFYLWFDDQGGFYNDPTYPSQSKLWIFMPTFEGIAYAVGIAWYDNSFVFSNSGLSMFIGRIGAYSYSLYLLHFFLVFRVAKFINAHVMPLTNFYVACAWSLAFFFMMYPLGYLSFRFIEAPFLHFRKHYPRPPTTNE